MYTREYGQPLDKANEMANALAKKARATVSHANPILKDKGY